MTHKTERHIFINGRFEICLSLQNLSISGVDFINMLTLSFYACRSQMQKMTDDLTVIFAILGSTNVKAWRKMLVKSTPDFDQIHKHFKISYFVQRLQKGLRMYLEC